MALSNSNYLMANYQKNASENTKIEDVFIVIKLIFI